MGDAQLFDLLEFLFRQRRIDDRGGSVDSFGDFSHLFPYRIALFIGEFQGFRCVFLDGFGNQPGQFHCAFPTVGEDRVHRKADPLFLAVFGDQGDLFVRIAGEAVEGDDHLLAEVFHVFDMLVQVGESPDQPLLVGLFDLCFGDSAVQLQALRCRYDNGQFRGQARFAAFDVEEFFRTEIRAEAGFGDDVIAVGQGHLGRQHGVAAVGDVGERAAVDEGRGIFGGLHQVGKQGVLQQDSDGACDAHVVHRERLAVISVAQQDIADAALQIVDVGGQAEDRHNFRGGRDVESRFGRNAVGRTSQPRYDVTKAAIVHVEHPLPLDLFQPLATVPVLVDVVVEQGGNHVVGRCHGVEVAREMQVDVFHRQHLRIAAAGCAALHAEAGTQGGFAQGDHRFLSDFVQAKRQADRYRSLADARLVRGDGRNQDQVVLVHLFLVDQVDGHLGDVTAVILDFVTGNPQLFGYVFYFI